MVNGEWTAGFAFFPARGNEGWDGRLYSLFTIHHSRILADGKKKHPWHMIG
jgi:hypothetical protein